MLNWVVLFRAINVGGNNPLPMSKLREELAEIGCTNVATYIQSGNVVLSSDTKSKEALCAEISTVVEANHGFTPHVIALRATEFERAASRNPFKSAEQDPKSLHLFFMQQAPRHADTARLDQLCESSESYELIDEVFYLHAPNGIGRSKLAVGAEKALATAVTARNWRTVTKITAMLRNLSGVSSLI